LPLIQSSSIVEECNIMALAIDSRALSGVAALTIGIAAIGQSAQARPTLEDSAPAFGSPETVESVPDPQVASEPIALDRFSASATTAQELQGPSQALAVAPSGLAPDPTFDRQLAQQPDRAANGRRNSSKFSYIGIGGAIGLSDDDESSTLGEGGFSLLSKTAFTDRLSLHNASVLGDKGTSVIALTVDFPIYNKASESIAAVPFVGGGVAISDLFGDDTDVGFALTGGVDVPLSYRWTATGRIAAGFFDDNTDLAILLGVGYTFTGFFK
jgi:hypothetical protein